MIVDVISSFIIESNWTIRHPIVNFKASCDFRLYIPGITKIHFNLEIGSPIKYNCTIYAQKPIENIPN